MKTLKLSLVLMAMMAVLSSCNKENLEGSGNVIEQTRGVSAFKQIESNGVFDVFITQGEVEALKVITDDNLMGVVETSVMNQTLYLDIDEDINLKHVTKMEIHVTVVDLQKLSFTGVGNIWANNLELDDFVLFNSGVGDVELSGSANQFYVDSRGVGNINALYFEGQFVDVESDGVGQVKVWAENTLSVSLTGVGDILYKGNADLKKVTLTGTGKIIKVD